MRGHCEVCDLPFRTRKEIEDQLDRGMESDEIYTWIQDQFNFEVSHDSVAGHKNHTFLADLYPFMHLKRPKPLPAEQRKAHIDATFPPEIREAMSKMKRTTEDDAQP